MEKGYNIILKKLNIIVSYLIIRVVDWFGKINLFLGVFYIKQELPINEQIRAKDVQVIDETGEKKGIMNINDALDLAYDKKMDLVLVSPNLDIPVCKIMNYGKYKFEQSKKEKEAKKKQKISELKEIRITPNIEQHDFEFKAKNIRKFIEDGNKVKITVRFRGRELNYVKLGEEALNKFIDNLSDIATPDKKAILEGKNMFIILSKKTDK
ncbi:MAG: translation initiation factor IF-3 [Clostridia bacterium]|jgi:translation initiation factor IF-3|nr:translation initiation factor IF-3 [Clostridium sp. CAG:798]HBJ12903.1 translation initiation factor IF-3 [Clostridiales bacterium]